MARTPVVLLLAIFAGASLVDAGDPKSADAKDGEGEARPTMEEYKANKAKEAEKKEEKDDDDKKGAAVNKVIEMMEGLQRQVIEEGEKEARTYDKFACFCRDMTKEKTRAIEKGQAKRTALSATIEHLQKQREDLDKAIADLTTEIEEAVKDMEKLQRRSDEDLAVYEKNEADLSAAIYGVREAIKVLKSSRKKDDGASLLQLQSMSKTISTALMLADALGLKSAKSAAQIFLQEPGREAPEVEMENYKFHSTDIIETCENLMKDFENEKNHVDQEEVDRVQTFNMEKQNNADQQKHLNKQLDEAKDAKDKTEEDLAEASQELTTVSATLLDDQQYLSELSAGCSAKAKTWDQRSKVRVAELTAITEAMDIVKATVLEKTQSSTIRFVQMPGIFRTPEAVANDEQSMMAIEAEAEEVAAPVGFLQRRMLNSPDGDIAKQMIVSLLKNKGMQLKSTLLMSMATQVAGDPLAKVKKLIQELIERLLTEAANEANQKGWCDKAMADAKQKRETSATKVDDLNARMAKFEARRDKLAEEVKELTEEMAELNAAQDHATKMRTEEKAENKETLYDANQGLEAVKMAIKILSRFYATAAKSKIDLSLSQASPWDEAPETSFKTGEAYTAVGSDSGGIVGMLQVIESDFERTIKETTSAEKSAEQEHMEFMTESSKSLAEKKVASEQKTEYLDETIDKLAAANEDLQAQSKIMVGSIKELIELKPVCVDTGMSYADRVAMREQEIESLKKALCILSAYAKSGPDGLSDAC